MIKAFLLDIEGTTTPIDFVHQRLFPFAKAKMDEFVRENLSLIGAEISELEIEHARDFAEKIYPGDFDKNSPASVAGYLKFLIDRDRKSTPLKALQGKIWQAGYAAGELESEIFADVPPAFERWRAEGKTIAIFSSGSVLAQKLIFKYSNLGDLTPLIDAYFDTTTGGKRTADSYRKIAASLNFAAEEILFVSDIGAELEAARASGFQTALAVRPGNAPVLTGAAHRIVESFDELE